MTDQFTSLTLPALKEMVSHINESIALMNNQNGRLTASEIQIKSMLTAVRRQLQENIRAKERENP